MDPVFEIVGDWWWIAPTVVGLGAVSYGALTAGKRRARRIEVDAARHEVTVAHAALVTARADVRTAHATYLAAKAGSAPMTAAQGRHHWQLAKAQQRRAALHLRAKRSAVKAARAQLTASAGAPDSPLARVKARHDAVTTRWLEYETDAAKVLAFPQMSDAQHPSTAAFLVAYREANTRRPSVPETKVKPPEFVAYRDAVTDLEVAFDAAERDARHTAERPSGPPPTTAPWRSAPPPRVHRVDPPAETPRRDPDASRTGAPPPVWPVPSRSPRPPASR